jgi:hypothetical protein
MPDYVEQSRRLDNGKLEARRSWTAVLNRINSSIPVEAYYVRDTFAYRSQHEEQEFRFTVNSMSHRHY